MTPERWRQVGKLFEAAVQVEPAGRQAWLQDVCGSDDDLRPKSPASSRSTSGRTGKGS